MKNTTKLKHILQLYTVELNMDEDSVLTLTIIHKDSNEIATFIDKAYSVVIRKAFGYMMKELKEKGRN